MLIHFSDDGKINLRTICIKQIIELEHLFTMSFRGRAIQRTWHLVDASSQTVGRLATTIAPLLKGKHKPTYRPNGDCGDYVVVVNAEKVCYPCDVM